MLKRRLFGIPMAVILIGVSLFLVLLILGALFGPIGQNIFGIKPPSWINVPQPHTELPAEPVFHIGVIPITNTMLTAWITVLFLGLSSFFISRRMNLVPGRLQSFFEFALGALYSFCTAAAGEKNGRRFFPLVSTIFLFVAFNAWLALIPGFNSITIATHEGVIPLFRPANTDVNMPLAIAIVAMFSVQVFGFKAVGLPYLQQFFNFGGIGRGFKTLFKGKVLDGIIEIISGVIEILVGFIELASQFIRILSFTFRLFGNMTAGEILVLVILFLVPLAAGVIFYGLELLIGFIQGLIFAGLTLVFLILAVSHHAEGSEAH